MRSRFAALLAVTCLALTLVAFPRPTAAATYTSSAGATPTAAAPGTTVSLGATVASDSATNLLVDLEIYRPDGQRVFQYWWDNQSFAAGQPRTLQTNWSVPAGAPTGVYTFKIGLFSPGWGALYSWNANAGQFSVGAAAPQPGATGTGLSATYFDNRDLTTPRLTRTDTTVNFNWGTGAPASGVGPDTFSARWQGQVQPQHSETYTFYTTSDDGVRLWVNGQQVINNWTNHAPVENQGAIALQGGQRYTIVLEYYEEAGGAQINLSWSSPSQAKQIIPTSRLYLPSVTGPAPTSAPPPSPTPTQAPPSPTPTKAPVAPTPTAAPGGGQYFRTLPPGAQLPSDAACAAAVKRRAENKRMNAAANANRVNQPLPSSMLTFGPRVSGNFSGTTDEILQWAACKWGIDEDIVRAQAVTESWWQQTALGDWTTDASRCAPGRGLGVDGRPGQCPESFGILQNRYPYEQQAWPWFQTSTAFNADLTYAYWRGCYEGYETWLNTVERGQEYAAGDAWGCLGRWFSGRWHTPAAEDYIVRVRQNLNDRVWEQPNFQEP